MTNIVGGNTGSLSQVGSSQDGSSSNPLSTNTSSDFLSLISVAFEGQKNSSGEVSKFDNTDKSLSSNDLNLPLDLQKGEQIVSEVEKQVSSDDISAFLKGLNVSSDKDNIDVGISTLQLLGRLSKSDAGSLEELNETVDANIKDFITELSAYMEINGIRSDKALDLQTSDIYSRIQSINTFVKENPEVLSFLGFVSNGKNASDVGISEHSDSTLSLKKLPFQNLTNAPFLYEQNDELKNNNKTSFLFNTDISNEASLTEKKAIEIKVTQSPDLFSIKVFDISNNKIKMASEIIDGSSTELGVNDLDHQNTLSIGIPNKDLSFIVLNVDVDNLGKSDFIPLPIALKPSDAFQKFYQGSSGNINSNETGVTEILKVSPTWKSTMMGADIKLTSDNLNEVLPSVDKTMSTNEKIDISFKDSFLKGNSKSLEDSVNTSLLSSKFSVLTDEQLRFVAEKLQQVNSIKKQDFISNNQVAEFIVRSRGNFAIESAISKVIKSELKTSENISTKKNLFISTADIIGYRQGVVNSLSDKNAVLKELSYFDSSIPITNTLGVKGEPDLLKEIDLPTISNSQDNKVNPVQLSPSGSRIDQVTPQAQTSTNIVTPQKLSLLDAQFTSRMATTLLEQAINSKENFDLILEPESFGKVRVNVSLENLQLDVKLTAENSATLAILRASESILQSISEINGLKLAEYNVELSNNNQNNNGSRDQKENSGEKDPKMTENQNELDDKLDSSNDDGSHNLNLIA
ncbi:flagellar hook-length control protein FliK [Paracoccaceae bacterium]|nr:flagellar hook-length control protein FliK [Paracoccaceae bacterium]